MGSFEGAIEGCFRTVRVPLAAPLIRFPSGSVWDLGLRFQGPFWAVGVRVVF